MRDSDALLVFVGVVVSALLIIWLDRWRVGRAITRKYRKPEEPPPPAPELTFEQEERRIEAALRRTETKMTRYDWLLVREVIATSRTELIEATAPLFSVITALLGVLLAKPEKWWSIMLIWIGGYVLGHYGHRTFAGPFRKASRDATAQREKCETG